MIMATFIKTILSHIIYHLVKPLLVVCHKHHAFESFYVCVRDPLVIRWFSNKGLVKDFLGMWSEPPVDKQSVASHLTRRPWYPCDVTLMNFWQYMTILIGRCYVAKRLPTSHKSLHIYVAIPRMSSLTNCLYVRWECLKINGRHRACNALGFDYIM